MTESLMPEIGCDSSEAVSVGRGRRLERVEVAGTVAAEYHCLRVEILDREAKFVKLNCNGIISC